MLRNSLSMAFLLGSLCSFDAPKPAEQGLGKKLRHETVTTALNLRILFDGNLIKIFKCLERSCLC